MKTMIKITATVFAMMFLVTLSPQAFADGKKTETTKISAKVDCNGCKSTIEKHMAFEKGVKDVVADVETKIVTIEYDPQKTNPETLAAEITKLGYDGKVMKGDCNDTGKVKKGDCKDTGKDCKDTKKDCESKCNDKKGEAKSDCKSSCKGKSKDPNCCDKK
jgi:copper chaperone CopZ